MGFLPDPFSTRGAREDKGISTAVNTAVYADGRSGHAALADAMAVYLCNPISRWQRGTNENTNGLLRQWFPRSTNFYALDPAEVTVVAASLKNRPRRTLDRRTPAEALQAIA